ncbi:MAG TPA: hypothetical protein VGB50_09780 [Flavobacterium sp.]|jgi:hypothetical protein
MELPEKTSQQSEDRPGNNNPDDNNWTSPAKRIGEIERLDIKESGSGRDRSQTPDTENLDQQITQIDEGTKQMQGFTQAEDSNDNSNADDNRDQ